MRLSQICIAITQLARGGGAWSPLSLWPDGILSPGMWISPRTLTSEWQDYTGTTPVVAPGTVADSSNPVGLALDIRAGATVLTDPGNHMLQSTSPARPLMSARVNLLTYTEDLQNAPWRNFDNGLAITPNQMDPAGNSTAVLLVPKSADGWHGIDYYGPGYNITGRTARVFVKPAGLRYFYLTSGALQVSEMSLYAACFDLTGEGTVVRNGLYNSSATIELDPSGYYICTAIAVDDGPARICFASSNSSTFSTFTGDDTSGFYFAWPDLRQGGSGNGSVSPYQSVPGDGSTYATDFPIAQKYDGVDDGMATATFTAGDLINGMDCQIPVRRDSAAACVAGLYNGIADATKFFGMAESGSGSGCVGSGAGTPTVWVDGVQLSGGTAVTRGTLHTALTVGDWHILEFRGLDLSAWTAAGFGLYTSYVFPGPRGDIMLFESTASTEDKDAARQYLADYYGVTLP